MAYIFHVVNGGMDFFVWLDPAPVQVDSCEVAPTAPIYYPINVQHWHNFENEVVSEDFSV